MDVSEIVIEWLMAGDPAIRWQVMRDLLDAPGDEVAAERARVENEGWGARFLALQDPDGLWAGGACFPADFEGGEPGQPWTSTMHVLQTLLLLGLPPDSAAARRTIALVAEHGRWEHEGQRYFDGEVEPCINGRTVEAGCHFGLDMGPLVARLLTERLDDGGWNCEAEFGSVRSSFDTTIDVLDGLVAWEAASGALGHRSGDGTDRPPGVDAPSELGSSTVAVAEGRPSLEAVRAAQRRGEEYLLERRLFRRLTTGEVVDPGYLEFAFPYYWHYDVLRALEHFRRVGADPDLRMAEAVDVVVAKRGPDGRWPLDRVHPGRVHFHLEEPGEPSRWITLRALRVLRWWESG